MTANLGYEHNVFINCPFDDAYGPLRDALVFAIMFCRLRPRCALEASNAGTTRIDKIVAIIRECRWGIHDISRTEPNAAGLPRFNMPFEPGLFLGAHRFGGRAQKAKSCLVLDRDPFRFQSFLSDIGGQDIASHGDEPDRAIAAVRNWLAAELREQAPRLASGATSAARFAAFKSDLPRICQGMGLEPSALTFTDTCETVSEWLIQSQSPPTAPAISDPAHRASRRRTG